jgi:anhydro-N-acetylmuramic acid kinase
MSGTSADGIDAALVDLSDNQVKLIAHHSHPLPSGSQHHIAQLALPSHNELSPLCQLDIKLAEAFAEAALELLHKAGTSKDRVRAIGSHGQTIRHQPPKHNITPFSLQIGDPNTIAEITGIDVVADFRRRDVAAGGHGAPLAPAFHAAVFKSERQNRVIVNIGGMANISYLHAGSDPILGFATGPGNVLMDAWILASMQKNYDHSGQWAATGIVDQELLAGLMRHPFIGEKTPKSTGREAFNIEWLKTHTDALQVSNEDVQATLLEFTAVSITAHIKALTHHAEVYICGGGAHNTALMGRLRDTLQPFPVHSTEKLGVHPDWVEAMTFAWLAQQTMEGHCSNLPSVSGAHGPRILGGIFQA